MEPRRANVRDNSSLFSAAQEVFHSGDQASSNTLLLYAGLDNELTQVGTETQIMGADKTNDLRFGLRH
jgi:hypothetical protein